MTTRADLPPDPMEAIACVDALAAALDEDRQELALLRSGLVREMVGPSRGGKAVAARALGVSWTQVQRALGEDVERRVRLALALADWTRDAYTVRAKGDHAVVSLGLDLTENPYDSIRLNAAYALITALEAAGLEVSADGLAVDVDGSGPGAALAAGREADVNVSEH